MGDEGLKEQNAGLSPFLEMYHLPQHPVRAGLYSQ